LEARSSSGEALARLGLRAAEQRGELRSGKTAFNSFPVAAVGLNCGSMILLSTTFNSLARASSPKVPQLLLRISEV
jgi:hypothetical protein